MLVIGNITALKMELNSKPSDRIVNKICPKCRYTKAVVLDNKAGTKHLHFGCASNVCSIHWFE